MPGQPSAPTMQLPKRWPLIIDAENRDETTAKDARLVNCYVEKRQTADGGPQWDIFQRVGLSQQSQPSGGAATGAGVFNWKGNIYSIFGTTVYKDGVSKGTVDGTNGVYRFSQCLGATPKLQFGNGVKAYNYDDGAGLVQITDADFPTAFVKGWAYLDGTTYVATSKAAIQGSAINDPTSWDPLNVLIAQIEPDGGVALSKQLVYVVIFKQWTTEIFYDAANATGSPLGTVQGAKINYGCASQDSVRELDGALFWLATNRNAGMYVVMLDNLKADIISTKSIERLLDNWDLTTIYSWTLKHDGHKFYGLTSVTSNMTLVYDASERMWSQWTDTNGNYWPIVDSTYNSTYGHILQHASNGKLYTADTSHANDDSSTIQVDIYTPAVDLGTKRGKYLPALYLDADQAQSELMIRCNDWDFDANRWTNFRRFDLSKRRPKLDNCGTFVRRAYNLRHAKNNVRMPRIRALDMQIDLCTL